MGPLKLNGACGMAFTNNFIVNISEWDFAKIFPHEDFTLQRIRYIVCIRVGHSIAIAMGLVKITILSTNMYLRTYLTSQQSFTQLFI